MVVHVYFRLILAKSTFIQLWLMRHRRCVTVGLGIRVTWSEGFSWCNASKTHNAAFCAPRWLAICYHRSMHHYTLRIRVCVYGSPEFSRAGQHTRNHTMWLRVQTIDANPGDPCSRGTEFCETRCACARSWYVTLIGVWPFITHTHHYVLCTEHYVLSGRQDFHLSKYPKQLCHNRSEM